MSRSSRSIRRLIAHESRSLATTSHRAWQLPSGLAEFFDREREPSWKDEGICSQTDPELFFPEKGGSTREAKRICQGCPVRTPCLEEALANEERFGIWGGMSERERRKLVRERQGVRVPEACLTDTERRQRWEEEAG